MKRTTWVTGLIATAAASSILYRYGKHSGASWAEYGQSLPGDEVIPHPDLEMTNAITIQAPAEEIWPWLVQMGYYRGGWFTDSTWRDWDYLPDKIMRFFVREEARKSGYSHRDAPTTSEVISEFQNLKVGDVILDGPPGTAFFKVVVLEPNKFLVLHSTTQLRFLFPKSIRENSKIGIGGEFTWGFFLQPMGDGETRLLVRTRGTIEPWWYRIFINTIIPIANILLARKMLNGVKQRVEQPAVETG